MDIDDELFGFSTEQRVDSKGNINTNVIIHGDYPGHVCGRRGCSGVLEETKFWIYCPVCGWTNKD